MIFLVFFLLYLLLWNMSGNVRPWAALLTGFMVDLLSPFPFGAFATLFFLESVIVTVLQYFFSNTKSLLALGIGMTVTMISSLPLLFLIALVVQGPSFHFEAMTAPISLSLFFSWTLGSIVFPILLCSMLGLLSRVFRRHNLV